MTEQAEAMKQQSTEKTIYNDGVLEIRRMTYREKWLEACAFGGINPKSMFIEFSEENPYA